MQKINYALLFFGIEISTQFYEISNFLQAYNENCFESRQSSNLVLPSNFFMNGLTPKSCHSAYPFCPEQIAVIGDGSAPARFAPALSSVQCTQL